MDKGTDHRALGAVFIPTERLIVDEHREIDTAGAQCSDSQRAFAAIRSARVADASPGRWGSAAVPPQLGAWASGPLARGADELRFRARP